MHDLRKHLKNWKALQSYSLGIPDCFLHVTGGKSWGGEEESKKLAGVVKIGGVSAWQLI